MKREVLPMRRNRYTLGNFLLCCWLSGCAAGLLAPHAPTPSIGYPMSVWTLPDFNTECDPTWLRPGLYCRPQIQPRHDGCRWTCNVELVQ